MGPLPRRRGRAASTGRPAEAPPARPMAHRFQSAAPPGPARRARPGLALPPPSPASSACASSAEAPASSGRRRAAGRRCALAAAGAGPSCRPRCHSEAAAAARPPGSPGSCLLRAASSGRPASRLSLRLLQPPIPLHSTAAAEVPEASGLRQRGAAASCSSTRRSRGGPKGRVKHAGHGSTCPPARAPGAAALPGEGGAPCASHPAAPTGRCRCHRRRNRSRQGTWTGPCGPGHAPAQAEARCPAEAQAGGARVPRPALIPASQH